MALISKKSNLNKIQNSKMKVHFKHLLPKNMKLKSVNFLNGIRKVELRAATTSPIPIPSLSPSLSPSPTMVVKLAAIRCILAATFFVGFQVGMKVLTVEDFELGEKIYFMRILLH